MTVMGQSLSELSNINLLNFFIVRIVESKDEPRISRFRFTTTALKSFVLIKPSVKRRDRMSLNLKEFTMNDHSFLSVLTVKRGILNDTYPQTT